MFLRSGPDYVEMTPQHAAFLEGAEPLLVTKANIKARVHRRQHMDYVGVKLYDAAGNASGELRILGLFTSMSLATPNTEVPLIRKKVAEVMQRAGYDPQGHAGKALMNALDTYPREELFQISTDQLYDFATIISTLNDRPRVRVLSRIDRFDNFVSVLVYVPRDRYHSAARERIGQYLAEVLRGARLGLLPALPRRRAGAGAVHHRPQWRADARPAARGAGGGRRRAHPHLRRPAEGGVAAARGGQRPSRGLPRRLPGEQFGRGGAGRHRDPAAAAGRAGAGAAARAAARPRGSDGAQGLSPRQPHPALRPGAGAGEFRLPGHRRGHVHHQPGARRRELHPRHAARRGGTARSRRPRLRRADRERHPRRLAGRGGERRAQPADDARGASRGRTSRCCGR